MAACKRLFYFAACLWLCHNARAKNDAPCQRSGWNNGFNKFRERHVRTGMPNGLNQNEWENFIRNVGMGCERPTQSFLDPGDLEKVKAVCTNQGGTRFKDNLCISRQPFTFITVRSEKGTCGIRSVRKETKHLILACDSLDNQCLPIHFEGNPEDTKPGNNARGCQDPQKGTATSIKSCLLWLFSLLVLFIYGL